MPTQLGENRFLRYGAFRYYPPGRTSVLELHRASRSDDWPLFSIHNAIMERSWPDGLYIRPAPADVAINKISLSGPESILAVAELPDAVLAVVQENPYSIRVHAIKGNTEYEVFHYTRDISAGPIKGASFHGGGRLFCLQHTGGAESFFVDPDLKFTPMLALPPIAAQVVGGTDSAQNPVPWAVRIAYRLRSSGRILAAGPPTYVVSQGPFTVFPVGTARIPQVAWDEYIGELVVLATRPVDIASLAGDSMENLLFHRVYYVVASIALNETHATVDIPSFDDLLKNEPYTEDLIPWVCAFETGIYFAGRYILGGPHINFYAPQPVFSAGSTGIDVGDLYWGVQIKTEYEDIWLWHLTENVRMPITLPPYWSYPHRAAARVALVWESSPGNYELLTEKRLRIGRIEAAYCLFSGDEQHITAPTGRQLPADIPPPLYNVGDRKHVRKHYLYMCEPDDRLAMTYASAISPGGPAESVLGLSVAGGPLPGTAEKTDPRAAPPPDGYLVVWTDRALYVASLDYLTPQGGDQEKIIPYLRLNRIKEFAYGEFPRSIMALSSTEFIGLSATGNLFALSRNRDLAHFLSGLDIEQPIKHIALYENPHQNRLWLVAYPETGRTLYIIDLLHWALYRWETNQVPLVSHGTVYVAADGSIMRLAAGNRARGDVDLRTAPVFFSPVANTVDNIWRIALRTEGLPPGSGHVLLHIEDAHTLHIPLNWQVGHWGASQNMPAQAMGRHFVLEIHIQNPTPDTIIWGLDVEYDVRKILGLR